MEPNLDDRVANSQAIQRLRDYIAAREGGSVNAYFLLLDLKRVCDLAELMQKEVDEMVKYE